MQDAEGTSGSNYPVMDDLLNNLSEVLLLEGQEILWSLRWLLGAFYNQYTAYGSVHDMLCFIHAGKEGWETDGDSEPALELIRNFSMMVQNKADQKHFKLSAMPCFGLVVVGDTLKQAFLNWLSHWSPDLGINSSRACNCWKLG